MTTSNGSWSSPGAFLHAHHDVAVHLDETAVAVPREAARSRSSWPAPDGLVVQSEVENRVHHARHRIARAGTDRDEQRVLRSPNFVPMFCSMRRRRPSSAPRAPRIRPLVRVVVGANLRRDREARGYGQSDAAHLGEVRALAAEQRLHGAVAVGLLAELIDTYFPAFSGFASCAARFARGLLRPFLPSLFAGSSPAHFRNIRDAQNQVAQCRDQSETRRLQPASSAITSTSSKELRHRGCSAAIAVNASR